jgi:hypothetical protein
LFAAGAVTCLFALWVYGLASEQVQTGSGLPINRWDQFISGEPNTMGDTLAGFIGSLTLIWVVASVIQQSMELRAQRREFAEMVRAQDAQVRALEAQSRIFEDERLTRLQDSAAKELDQLLKTLHRSLKEISSKRLDWEFDPEAFLQFHGPRFETLIGHFTPFQGLGHMEQDIEDFLPLVHGPLHTGVQILRQMPADLEPDSRNPKPHQLFDVIQTLQKTEAISTRLSESEQIKIRRLKVSELLAEFVELEQAPNLWAVAQ